MEKFGQVQFTQNDFVFCFVINETLRLQKFTCCIQPILDLLSIVDLQKVIASKFYVVKKSAVLKEVYWECHCTFRENM